MERRKAFSVLFFLSLAQFAYVTDARLDPGEYWKIVMNGEEMPKAITDLLDRNPDDSDPKTTTDRFVRNFDTKPNVIIYHSHDHHNVHSEKSKPADG